MIVGCPKEIKPQEGRVGLLPSGVYELVRFKHTVFIQSGAGVAAGATDTDYEKAGAKIIKNAKEIYEKADLIVKVKEPQPCEYEYLRKNQIIITFFHFASNKELLLAVIKSGSICIAYETIENKKGILNILECMSIVAGKLAVYEAIHLLSSFYKGGKGILIGGVAGGYKGNVLILGGGAVGFTAAKTAAAAGAAVVVLDNNIARLREIDELLPANCTTLYSNEETIREEIKKADIVIGAVLVCGGLAPKIIKKEYIKQMKKGSVVIDVSIDHGGCIEGIKQTTHKEPVYTLENVIFYAVSNIPGAVPITSTHALTNSSFNYILSIANKGWIDASLSSIDIKKGINVAAGVILHKQVAQTFDMPCADIDEFLKQCKAEKK